MKRNYEIDSNYYDSYYEDSYYEDYRTFIEKSIRDKNLKVDSVLDLGCGTGRLLNILNYKYRVGVDKSKEMLDKCKDKNIQLIQSDMINFQSEDKFDLILSTSDAINYILEKNDLITFFNNVNKHLKDSSIFIFDLNGYNFYKMPNFIHKEKIGNDIHITDHIFSNSQLTMNISYFVKQSDDLFRLYEEKHIQRGYKYKILTDIIKNCFGDNIIIKTYNSLLFDEFSEDSYKLFFVIDKFC